MSQKKILVTGGCGYIGSHVCALLSESGYKVIVLDDLSTGHAHSLLHDEPLYVGNFGDINLLEQIDKEHHVSAIFHFAGSIIVPESIQKPVLYYQNNVSNTLNLIDFAKRKQLSHFILSSSAAVYGDGHQNLIDEDASTHPIHPYGRSKLIDEWILQDVASTCGLKFVAIRYFNVAGADHDLRIGQSSKVSTHLIKVACEVAVGLKDQLKIFGNDYPTPDGSCVRDYVHVIDLANAHIQALKYLEGGGESNILNCGYNQGYSVIEVIETLERTLNKTLPKTIADRRPGDVASLVASADKIQSVLDWTPQYHSLDTIIKSSYQWEEKLKAKRDL